MKLLTNFTTNDKFIILLIAYSYKETKFKMVVGQIKIYLSLRANF